MNNYITILSSSLLLISEILPYIPQVKGNSIIQTIINSYSKYEEDKKLERSTEHQEVITRLDKILTIIDKEKKD